jgi:hypothetical protein
MADPVNAAAAVNASTNFFISIPQEKCSDPIA